MKQLAKQTETNTALQKKTFNASLFNSWISFLDVKPKTVQTYTRAIRQFFYYMLENDIQEPLREDVIAYREELKRTKKATTVQAYLQAVKLFFEWTEATGVYPNVAKRVKNVQISKEYKKEFLTEDQAKKLLAAPDRTTLQGKRDYAMLALLLTCGLRTIELARAKVSDVQPSAGGVVLYIQGKGRDAKDEYVKIVAPVHEALQDYIDARGKLEVDAPLFCSLSNRNYGSGLTTRSISRIVKNYLESIGLTSSRYTAHSLRHTAATLNLLHGGSLEETQQLLRHQNIQTTMIYNHAIERARNRSEERIASAIFAS